MKQENTKLSAQLDRCRKKEEDMQTQIKEAMFNAKPAADRADRNEQYSRRNNVKLPYVPEAASSLESAEENDRKALQVFHNRLDLNHITPEHTEAAQRVGVKRAGSTRLILVKFLSRKTMQQVIQKRRKLKNTEPKVVIVEDLTKSNYNLFLCASDHPGASRVWTSSGKVFVQDTDSKIHKIEKLSDLQRLPCDAASLATSTPAGATAAQQRHNRQPMNRRGPRPNKWRNIFSTVPPLRRWRYSRRPVMRHQRSTVVRSSRQTCVGGVFVNAVSRDTPDQRLALNGRVLLSVLCCVTRLCDTCVDCIFFGFPEHERAEFSPISYGTVCLHVAFVFVCLFV